MGPRSQAVDDMLSVVLGWLESTKTAARYRETGKAPMLEDTYANAARPLLGIIYCDAP